MKAVVAALVVMLCLPVVVVRTAAQEPPAASSPQVVVVFNLRSSNLLVIDHKYRVFFNKFERKNIPIEGYDLNGAIRDEVMTMLAADKRFQCRVATEADKLDPIEIVDEKRRTPAMLAGVQGDRVLLMDVEGFGAWISGLAKDRMEIVAHATMLDRASGRKLWQERIHEKIPFSGSLQTLQADNQKELRQGINTLIEKACLKLKTKVAKSKV